ncbi:60S ribosomal protein L10a [Podospora appendiculata]|uniref:60S ribosomal protein L10a n=1 Tax=Podospora appendiculata TaxID=314037 RepID=A0AAE1CHD6_9PEZI|nr:60S ribosomal protein L10a [Podospora appendiculata]
MAVMRVPPTPGLGVPDVAKITVAGIRAQVDELLHHALHERRRNFVESVELQITLRGYDPSRDKRFAGAVRLPTVPRPQMAVCVLHLGVDAVSIDDLKRLNKNKKLVKKFAGRYHAFVASTSIIRQIPRVVGPGFFQSGKFPTPVSHGEDLAAKIVQVKSTIKFQLERVLFLGVVFGNVQMTTDELVGDLMMAINCLVSLLKKGWQNVGRLVVKSSMSPGRRLF